MEFMLDDILLEVFSYFDANTLLKCSCVNKHWNRITKYQGLWKNCVLRQWPSQRWLYKQAPVSELNWNKTYQDLLLYSWYSPDEMKYFASCNTIEDELISKSLREIMFYKMENIKKKWSTASVRDHDGNMVSRHFNQNMELFFNCVTLEWVFLDKRRGYMDDLFAKTQKRQRNKSSRSCFIRPYQVIPSCLLMYRWLSMFRSLATAESGLTFYRIWRFRLKHIESGLIFELSDWKAAMSCTFSNGCPNITCFKNDALELLQVLTHPHFIMHHNGLNPRIERTFLYAIHASAGGCVANQKHEKHVNRRRKRSMTPRLGMPNGCSFIFQGKEQLCFQDIDEKLERWRARRRLSLKSQATNATSPPPPLNENVNNFQWSDNNLSRHSSYSSLSCQSSSYSNLNSEAESTTTDDSQREFTASDCDSEFNFYENGYVTNCEYFISDSQCIESVEEQHSLQAVIADNWTVYQQKQELIEKIPVVYDIDDSAWYIQSERGFHIPESRSRCLSPVESNYEENQNAKIMRLGVTDQVINSGVERLHLQIPQNIQSSPPPVISPALYNSLNVGVIEAIPSSLALYRLICLFELNCTLYVCFDENSIWQLSMQHKKTGGIIHFKDYNGIFQVYVSMNEIKGCVQERNKDITLTDDALQAEILCDTNEFHTGVHQLLNLIMSEGFCHPYGTIAGAVA